MPSESLDHFTPDVISVVVVHTRKRSEVQQASPCCLSRSMNSLELQARSFFLRCRARYLQSWPKRTGRNVRSLQRGFVHLEQERAEQHSYDPIRVETRTQKAASSKPYYVTTPIYYVNAGASLQARYAAF